MIHVKTLNDAVLEYCFRKGIQKKTGTMFSLMPLTQLNVAKGRKIQAVFIQRIRFSSWLLSINAHRRLC